MTATSALTEALGHEFACKELLRQALTHRSFGVPHNERLEFLGDGVLNFVIASLLYQRFPEQPEGDLSRLRSHLVKELALSELAASLDLGNYLLLGDGELKSAGRSRPSVLADAVEAIIGATYLDGGFAAAEALVTRLYTPLFETLDPKSVGKDPKTLLQEYLQGRKLGLPEYAVVATVGEAHCQTFRVECRILVLDVCTVGEGSSRRAAEQLAASNAYQEINHD